MKSIIVLIGLVMCVGCASVYTVANHDKETVARRAVELKAIPGGAAISFDLLQLGTGYFATWADNPGKMTVATLADMITVGGLYLGAKELDEDDSESVPSQAYTVNGDGNTFIVGNTSGVSVDNHRE